MNQAFAAHLRILESMPRDRIRTHEHVFVEDNFKPGRPPGDLPERRRQTIRELAGKVNPATGKLWLQREIAVLLGISKMAVRKHQRVIRGGVYHRKGSKRG